MASDQERDQLQFKSENRRRGGEKTYVIYDRFVGHFLPRLSVDHG